MTKFQEIRKAKLSIYKNAHLTLNKGTWHNVDYDHILPLDEQEKNIIYPIRTDFWKNHKGLNIKLHQYFHHLNSSQALCFNLFYPLFCYNKSYLTYVLHRIIEVAPVFNTPNDEIAKLLSIRNETQATDFAKQLDDEFLTKNIFVNCEFEKILIKKEFTNFDFYVELQNDYRVLFEIKYTESEFGKAKSDLSHIYKYNDYYKPILSKILRSEFIDQEFVFENYQIIRNLSYLDEKTTVVFIFPEANNELKKTKDLLRDILLPIYFERTRVIYLETLTSEILNSEYLMSIHHIFETFKQKYID